MKPNPMTIEDSAQPQKGASICHMTRYSSVATNNVATPSKNDARRPQVSATTPVGTSKTTWPTVKNAFAPKAWAFDRPASRRNSVLTPQMNDAANVDSKVIVR